MNDNFCQFLGDKKTATVDWSWKLESGFIKVTVYYETEPDNWD